LTVPVSRRIVALALVVGLAVVGVGAQRRLRIVPVSSGGGQQLLSSTDFEAGDYLGAFAVSSTISASWGENCEPYYGDGFALKTETGDSNNLHFFTLCYSSTLGGSSSMDVNGTSGDELTVSGTFSLGGPWAKQTGSGNMVYSNASRIRGDASGHMAYYADDTTPDNQLAAARLTRFTNVGVAGVAVRMATGDLSKYTCVYDGPDARWELQEHNAAGTITVHASSAATLSNSATYLITLEAIGSAITCYIAPPSFAAEVRLTVTDATLATGRSGLFAFDAATNSTGYHLWEWRTANADYDAYTLVQARVPAFQNPSPATTLTSYNNFSTTGMKVYPASAFQRKRQTYYDGYLIHMTSTLNGDFALHYDATGDWLYTSYFYGYLQGQCPTPQIFRTRTTYATPSGVSEGPWFFSSEEAKSTAAYLWEWPSSFITAANLGTKRLAAGAGSAYSIVGECDASIGPAVLAFTPPADGATTMTSEANTPVLGYQPYSGSPGAGVGRMTRNTAFIHATRGPTDPAWSTTKANQEDYTYGGVYVETATRRGVAFLIEQCQGQWNYQNSGLACEYYRPHIAIYDPDDLADVANGMANRYDLQPTSEFEINLPFLDYTAAPYADPTAIAIIDIQATAGAETDGTTDLPVVTTATPHGFTAGSSKVSIRGTTNDAQFGQIWVVHATPTTTSFTFHNTTLDSTFDGSDATGGNARAASSHGSNSTGFRAMTFHSSTGILYIHAAVLNSGTARMLVGGFQIP
jgi:hypothetical protein